MKFTRNKVDFKPKKLTSFSPVIKCASRLLLTKPPLTPGVKLYGIQKTSKLLHAKTVSADEIIRKNQINKFLVRLKHVK